MTMTATAPDVMRLAPVSEMAAARAAGWRGCDLVWERLQERAHQALAAGDRRQAAWLWRRAWWLAQLRFSRRDPRFATSLANAGAAAMLGGNPARARRAYVRAFRLWGAAPDWIDGMTIARRARSSLFHLRMESEHWDAYQGAFRRRAMDLAREGVACLDAAARGAPAPFRLYDRWQGERPLVFDDLRKFLGAVLLLAVANPALTEI